MRDAVGGIQISASHNPPQYNGLKFFQPRGMVLSPEQGRAVLDRWQRKDFAWASWDSLGKTRPIEDPDEVHLERVLEIVDVEAIRRRGVTVVALDACHGSGGRLAVRLLRALGCRPVVLGGEPDGDYDHLPEPTEKNLRSFSAIVPAVGAAVGFAQDPDADRLAIVDESGRYIGEELTLALAALRRLDQIQGPVVLNLSTSKVTEELARRFGCPVVRTPVGEINVVEAMLAENAVLGGEGNGGVIDPRVGLSATASSAWPWCSTSWPAPSGPCRAGSTPCLGSRWSRTSIRWARDARVPRRSPHSGSGSPSLSRGEVGPARRTAARLGRSLGACPLQQYRADRAGHRRGDRGWDRSQPGRPGRPLGERDQGHTAMSETAWPTFERPPRWHSSMWTARCWLRRPPSSSPGSSFAAA